METVNSQQSQLQPGSGFGTLWRKLKVLLITSSLFGLISLNILTAVNDNIHSAVYHGIKSILASVISDMALSRMLNNSPTVKNKRDIAAATKALTDEKTRLTTANKSLEKKHAALEKSHKEITAKHANLEKSHKEISTKHGELKRTSVAQAAVAQKVSKQVAARSLANATRNVSSMLGEAVPFMGASIIVIVTGWDIYDACQTMKDMNTLSSAYGHSQEDHTKVCGMKVPSKEELQSLAKEKWNSVYKSTEDALKEARSAMVPAIAPQ